MKTWRGIITIFVALAVLAGEKHLAMAGEKPPCAELRLKGDTVLTLPCPEDLERFLGSLRFKPAPGPDRRPVIEPYWPYDDAMVRKPPAPDDGGMVRKPEEQ